MPKIKKKWHKRDAIFFTFVPVSTVVMQRPSRPAVHRQKQNYYNPLTHAY